VVLVITEKREVELESDSTTKGYEYFCDICDKWLEEGETIIDSRNVRVCLIHKE
jgi:hypothetical protein